LAPISSFVQGGSARLNSGPHPERARADAELLLLHLLGKDKAWLMTHLEEELAANTAARYIELLERRSHGEPIQYITGECEFYGLSFRVTPDVLIPRPETEHLVEKVLALAMIARGSVTGNDFSRAENRTKEDRALASEGTPSRFQRILDVGTGSGAIAVALARYLPHAEIAAVDVSAAALEVAHANAECNAVSSRIRFLQGDLLSPVANEQFDLIVSNPPYVPEPERATLSVEVRDHEPALALFAGPDGLGIYRLLIPQAFTCLVPGGFVVLEIGYDQSPAITELLVRAGFEQIEFIPDLQGIPRVVCARRPAIPSPS
jgi:release factor glutamine methyltransferase